ncbi:hypothetical protein LXL04_012542 [Taraxacum kok-saghyz]
MKAIYVEVHNCQKQPLTISSQAAASSIHLNHGLKGQNGPESQTGMLKAEWSRAAITSSSQDWEVHSDFNADNVIADHTQNMNAGAKQPSDTSLHSSSSDSTHIRKRPTAKTPHKRPPHSLKLKDSLWGTRATQPLISKSQPSPHISHQINRDPTKIAPNSGFTKQLSLNPRYN